MTFQDIYYENISYMVSIIQSF